MANALAYNAALLVQASAEKKFLFGAKFQNLFEKRNVLKFRWCAQNKKKMHSKEIGLVVGDASLGQTAIRPKDIWSTAFKKKLVFKLTVGQ